ncbi:unnamed protein product [Rhizoctonia solani]|uniref:Uncharacterized protein n=1 Tax=Rhizoctonia solani TaxID=456999 RepID=A0A8H3HMH1_9AGAM|nr:unnamed protein product [Rhizoctonia solani]
MCWRRGSTLWLLDTIVWTLQNNAERGCQWPSVDNPYPRCALCGPKVSLGNKHGAPLNVDHPEYKNAGGGWKVLFVLYRISKPTTFSLAASMIFNLFLVIFWLLALVSPVGDYHKYIKSLSDPRISAPDNPAHVAVVSELVLSVSPAAPAPLPRYSPLVVPVLIPVEAKVSKPHRFTLGKRMFAVFKWVDTFLARITHRAGRPRPTKTFHHPTKVFVPVYPAPPAPGSHILDGSPAYSVPATATAFDPARLWDAYKLIISWIFVTFLLVVLTFARFVARARPSSTDPIGVSSDNTTPDDFTFPRTESLDFLPVTHDDTTHSELDDHGKRAPQAVPWPATTEDESIELTDSRSSAPNDAAHALLAWIDTKTGVEGSTDTDGASGGGKTLEPAVSTGSIDSILRLYAGERSFITPSPSDSSVPGATGTLPLDPEHFPPGGQVHTPRHKRWLEGLITHIAGMERRRNFHGRVYDNWTDNPDSQGSTGNATLLRGAPRPDRSPTPLFSTRPAVTLTSTSPGSFAADLSISVSQCSLYEQLADWVDPPTHHTSDSRDRPFDRVQGDPHFGANLCPLDVPLPPSPDMDRGALITQGVDHCIYITDPDPAYIPLPPSPLIIRGDKASARTAI